MSSPKFGSFESNPVLYTDTESWVLQHDNVWRKMNSGEVLHHAGIMSAEKFREVYGDLPALPKEAFENL